MASRLRRWRWFDGNETIQVKTTAVDLGCDVTYTGNKAKREANKRCQEAKRRMKRIGLKKWPKKFKKTVTKQAGHAVALYGCEINYFTKAQWHTLRKQTVATINLKGAGSNAWLAASAMSPDYGPQFSGLVRRIRFWRKMLRTFPHMKQSFLEKVAKPNGKRGPASCFAKTLADVGWTCLQHGVCKHTNGMCFNWVDCSNKFLSNILEKYWADEVQKQVVHCKRCANLRYDLQQTAASLSKLATWDQGIVVAYVSGKFFTHDILTKFCHNVTVSCPLCNQTDSRQHRAWGCNFYTDLRVKYKKAFQWLQKQPVWVSELALLPAQRDFLQQRIQWMTQFLQLHIPSEDHTAQYIFTDGTAFNGEQWDLCIAAGGFCVFRKIPLLPQKP